MRHANRHRAFRMPYRLSNRQGFTLVEAVIVIAITGIISAIVAVFIVKPVEGYVESVERAQLTDVADTAMRRIARDVRLALPNSVRVSADGSTLELLLTKTGGRYLAEEDMQPGGNILQFGITPNCTATPEHCQFDVVGNLPAGHQAINAGDWIVVYNMGPNYAGFNADAYAGGNRAAVTGVDVTDGTITLASNPFAVQSPPMKSPSTRFQVVTTPVTYHCDTANGRLVRYWNYPITAAQATATAVAASAGVQSAWLADGVQNCSFQYLGLANVNSALVGMRIAMRSVANNETINLVHQVHVDNTP